MYYWGNGGVHWWDWLLMVLGMIAFWSVFIWLVASLVRWGAPRRTAGFAPSEDSAEALLKRRFAAGDIDEDEYRHRLGVLRGREHVGTG